MDYKKLEKQLSEMNSRSKLFNLVKVEMKRRGHWRNKARGLSFVKDDPRANKSIIDTKHKQ